MKKVKVLLATAIITIVSCFVSVPVLAANTENSLEETVGSDKRNVLEEVTTFSELGIMFDAWEQFVAENPDSTEEEQEAFLILFVEEGGIRNIKNTRGLGDYIPGYNNLNKAEKELLLQHPLQAIQVFNCANKATDITVEYYGSSGWQDNSDAFRHCIWNALMKKAIGESAAEAWATAHEDEASGIDKEMDLFNNIVGRGISVSGKSDSQIAEAVKGKVSGGSCRRIVNDKLVETDSTGLIK